METEPSVHGSMELPLGLDWTDTPDGKEETSAHGHDPQGRSRKRSQQDAEDRIPTGLDQLKAKAEKAIGLGTSFEVQLKEMTIGKRRVAFLFLSVFTKDATMVEVLKRLSQLDPSSVDHDAIHAFLDYYTPAMQVKKTDSFSEMVGDVLVGNTVLYVEGQSEVLSIDAKQFPARNPEQPVLEKVVRGSKDGFTETLLMNVGLIRRRLRDRNARFEIMQVGLRSQTDVCIAYLNDISDPQLVEAVRDKIKNVRVDGLPLADKQLEEMMLKRRWSPFPMVRYTERPDVVAAQMLEGSVAILTDTSPSAILLPTTYFDLVQHAEENRQNPFMGTYLRWVRFFGILTSMFMLPLWFLYATHTSMRPNWLWFVGADKTGELPLILQFVIAEMGVDLMRLAAVHTPAPLVTAMTLLSAILIGDIAVKTGLFINEVILYMAVSAIGMFATPSYELGLANRIVRLGLLVAAWLFGAPGFVLGTAAMVIYLACERSFNSPYLWPFIPFNGKALLSILLRKPLPDSNVRPSINRPKQLRKQPT